MTTNYHTAIASGAAANAATFNTPLGSLDAQISANATGVSGNDTDITALQNGQGGSSATAQVLKEWVESGAFESTSITYHGTYTNVISTATVKWPDGSAGTYTATSINTTWSLVDAFTVSHTDSSQTVTQTAVTRNADGQITAKPALTVA